MKLPAQSIETRLPCFKLIILPLLLFISCSTILRSPQEIGLLGKVLLSFDDGPYTISQDDHALLDLLGEEGIEALFFLVGNKVSEQPDVVRRIHQEGHTIGFHSWNHEDFLFKGIQELMRELKDFEILVSRILGEPFLVEFIRPPYGIINSFLEADLRQAGFRLGYTTQIPNDSFVNAQGGAKYFQDLLDHVLTQNGGMIVLHNGVELWYEVDVGSYTDPRTFTDRSWIRDELAHFIPKVRALGLDFASP